MAVFQCKMCGAPLDLRANTRICECKYCGTTQTLPKLDDERRVNLYDRANHFRRNNDFDKAMGIYEKILNEDKTDSEAYWSLVLCKYGIEYVEDGDSHRRKPTVNRTQFTSIYSDEDYRSAIEYADESQRQIYEAEAKVIDGIQKEILEISRNESPFDIFICYKEKDSNGRRTQDSVLANELYYQLTNEGYKVFFARITLEDKLGTAYEPYIFAALNSAKVMIVLGTRPEYFNAVWVKNEWSRYLAMMKVDGKKTLIPAYRDMDPYDLPEEFSHLQAQDMSKLGFVQDLLRGVKKLLNGHRTTQSNDSGNVNIDALLERGNMALEDGEWERADNFFEQVLNLDARYALAYVGKLCAELQVREKSRLRECREPFEENKNYLKAVRFGSDSLINELQSANAFIKERLQHEWSENIYLQADQIRLSAVTGEEFTNAARLFLEIPGYKDADVLARLCLESADEYEQAQLEKRKRRRKTIIIVGTTIATVVVLLLLVFKAIIPSVKYNRAKKLEEDGWYNQAILAYERLNGFRDSKERISSIRLSSVYAKNVDLGDIIYIGEYNNQEIAWRVLEKTDDSIFVISEYILADKMYNEDVETTWESSMVRQWLNNTFYEKAFNEVEKDAIQISDVKASSNPNHSTEQGNNTQDRLFLLDVNEADEYFSSDEDRIGYLLNGESDEWWLRTMGSHDDWCASVTADGEINYNGYRVYLDGGGVRPAMWINLFE